MGVEHGLKTWPVYFERLWNGDKTFEVRRNDRNYQAGDVLVAQEWQPLPPPGTLAGSLPAGYTGRELRFRVTYVMPGGKFGIDPEFCVLGIRREPAPEPDLLSRMLERKP